MTRVELILAQKPLYPTMNSLNEAIKYIESQVPVIESNDMYALLMLYHNTLLKVLNDLLNDIEVQSSNKE